MDTKKDKKMGRIIGITFIISLILGLSIGFIIGSVTVIYVGKNIAEDFIEDNEIKIMPALILDINKTMITDYTKDLMDPSNFINNSGIDVGFNNFKENIINKIKTYGD